MPNYFLVDEIVKWNPKVEIGNANGRCEAKKRKE